MPGLIIPAYFGPQYGATNKSNWNRLSLAANSLKQNLIVVANPYNGPGTAAPPIDEGGDQLLRKLTPIDVVVAGTGQNGTGEYWQDYLNAIREVRDRMRGRVIGYVRTNYGSINLSVVKSDIDTWYSWYNRLPFGFDGIFFDEASSNPSNIPYYQDIYNYVKSKSNNAIVVNNFGVFPDLGYFRIGDSILVICENTYEGFLNWYNSFQPSLNIACGHLVRSCFLIHTAKGSLPSGQAKWEDVLRRTESCYVKWYYCTDDQMNNPWDSLPIFFQNMVTETQDVNSFILRLDCSLARFLKNLNSFEDKIKLLLKRYVIGK